MQHSRNTGYAKLKGLVLRVIFKLENRWRQTKVAILAGIGGIYKVDFAGKQLQQFRKYWEMIL